MKKLIIAVLVLGVVTLSFFSGVHIGQNKDSQILETAEYISLFAERKQYGEAAMLSFYMAAKCIGIESELLQYIEDWLRKNTNKNQQI